MDSKELKLMKEIWALMLEYGQPTTPNFRWCYYTGFDLVSNHWSVNEKLTKQFYANVKSIGVDWENTTIPEYLQRSEFTSTGYPSKFVDTWTGTITLLDGSEYHVGAKDIEYDIESKVSQLVNKVDPEELNLIDKYFGE